MFANGRNQLVVEHPMSIHQSLDRLDHELLSWTWLVLLLCLPTMTEGRGIHGTAGSTGGWNLLLKCFLLLPTF